MTASDVDAFYAGHALARAVHDRVAAMIASIRPAETRVRGARSPFGGGAASPTSGSPGSTSPIRDADVVLSIALPVRIESGRWKEVVRPATTTWMHHLEVRSIEEIDREVLGWLALAFDAAGPGRGVGGRRRSEERPVRG